MGSIGVKLRGIAVVAASVIALAACGGGSGGSNTTASGTATVNSTSAPTLAGAIFSAGGQGSSNTGMAAGIATSGSHPGISAIVKNVLDMSTALVNQQGGTPLAAGASSSSSQTLYGCGTGTDVQTITVNSYTGTTPPYSVNLTISDTYTNYQDTSCSGPIYNGSSSVTGNFEVYTDASGYTAVAPLNVSIVFTSLSTLQNSDTTTISGNFGYTFNWSDTTYYTTYSSATFTMNANYTDSNYSGDTFSANNFAVSFDQYSDILSVSGTLGDSAYGSVAITTTPNPLTYNTCGTGYGILDTTDSITLTGANGSSATIHFVNDGQCTAGTNGIDYGYTLSWVDSSGTSGSSTTVYPY